MALADWREAYLLLAEGIVSRIPAFASLDAIATLLSRPRHEVAGYVTGDFAVSGKVVEVRVEGDDRALRFRVEVDEGAFRIVPGGWPAAELSRRLGDVPRRDGTGRTRKGRRDLIGVNIGVNRE